MIITISRNKNNNYNSNDNDLKDEQDHWFKKKEILIWTRNWSGLHAFLKYMHYARKQFKTTAGTKKIKTMAYIAPSKGNYPSNG